MLLDEERDSKTPHPIQKGGDVGSKTTSQLRRKN